MADLLVTLLRVVLLVLRIHTVSAEHPAVTSPTPPSLPPPPSQPGTYYMLPSGQCCPDVGPSLLSSITTVAECDAALVYLGLNRDTGRDEENIWVGMPNGCTWRVSHRERIFDITTTYKCPSHSREAICKTIWPPSQPPAPPAYPPPPSPPPSPAPPLASLHLLPRVAARIDSQGRGQHHQAPASRCINDDLETVAASAAGSGGLAKNGADFCAHRDNGVTDVWLEIELEHIYYVRPSRPPPRSWRPFWRPRRDPSPPHTHHPSRPSSRSDTRSACAPVCTGHTRRRVQPRKR